jgi:hypothetical protein
LLRNPLGAKTVNTTGDHQIVAAGTELGDAREPTYEDGSPVDPPPEPNPTKADSAESSTHTRSLVQGLPPPYPIDGAELARRLLGDQNRVREYNREDYVFVQHKVRETLRRLGCPKHGSAPRSNWVVDEEMANRVADELQLPRPH